MNSPKINSPIERWGYFLERRIMDFKAGYAYHIKDEYFTLASDDKLMQNKEGANYRPTYY